ncbi:4938_t:CDS:1, partial [Acaulospora colombiana]
QNATTYPNYNKEVLARGQAGPRATTKHTKVEKKHSSVEKTASLVEENLVEMEHTTPQMQQLQAHGSQVNIGTNNSAPPLKAIALKRRPPRRTAKQAQPKLTKWRRNCELTPTLHE